MTDDDDFENIVPGFKLVHGKLGQDASAIKSLPITTHSDMRHGIT